jgi:phage gp37-like protein
VFVLFLLLPENSLSQEVRELLQNQSLGLLFSRVFHAAVNQLEFAFKIPPGPER